MENKAFSRDFYFTESDVTGNEALKAGGSASFLVIRLAPGDFRVATPPDFYRKLKMWKKLEIPLGEVPLQAFEPYRVEIYPGSLQDAEDDPRELEEGEILLVLEQGEPLGLLVGEHITRSIPQMVEPPFDGAEPPPVVFPPEDTEPVDEIPGRGLLDGEDQPEEAAAGEETPSPPMPAKRFINTVLKDRSDNRHDPNQKSLETGEVYSLNFDVDTALRPESITGEHDNSELRYTFQPGEKMAAITVRIETDDFDLYDEPEKKLFVPESGPSKNRVSFSISPKRDGLLVLNAIFLKDGNFIQILTFKFQAGGEAHFEQTGMGRTLSSVTEMEPRELSLTILNQGDGFKMILLGSTAATATVKITLPQLKSMVDEARAAIMKVVNFNSGGKLVYQAGLKIPEAAETATRTILAEAGYRLYQQIFFTPNSDPALQNLGTRLREILREKKCKFQIFSEEFVLPWGMLYLADRFNPADVKPELFLGLSHIVEHIPLQQVWLDPSTRIDTSTGLKVNLNLNSDIDSQMGYAFIGKQVQYWEGLKGQLSSLQVLKHTTVDEVRLGMCDPEAKDQVLYFYCHGTKTELDAPGGADASALVLSKNGRMTLHDLHVYAPIVEKFPNAPLVFINACESAGVSPLIFDGFVPYFMAKGARGVIGTETKVPAYFALAWATRFFDRFFTGESLGETFLTLRKEFYREEGNILGLLYSLYVDCDTRLEPAVLAASA